MSDQVTAVPKVEPTAGTGRARIESVEESAKGASFSAIGTFAAGIGRVDFLLVDLGNDQSPKVVDRRDVHYSVPLPNEVSETWRSVATLAPGATYRAFFHVYDRSGTNLVAYDRSDFTCTNGGQTELELAR
jgi:hypothetical protein